MRRLSLILAASAATAAIAVPAAAQTPYPYPYPQQTYPQQAYPGYGHPQQQGGLGAIINQLLGNRYAANDRLAVERCASAAVVQASHQYRPNHNPYGQGYGYQQQGYPYPQQGYGYGNQGYHPAATMRVTAITEVRRRQNGVRVAGLLDSHAGIPPYGQAYGYHNQGYAATGDLTFRCNVDYRGAVTDVRIRRNTAAYRRY